MYYNKLEVIKDINKNKGLLIISKVEIRFHEKISLNACLKTLNEILENHFVEKNFMQSGKNSYLTFILIDLNKDSLKELSHIIVKDADLDRYVEENIFEDLNYLNVSELWIQLAKHYKAKIGFSQEDVKFFSMK